MRGDVFLQFTKQVFSVFLCLTVVEDVLTIIFSFCFLSDKYGCGSKQLSTLGTTNGSPTVTSVNEPEGIHCFTLIIFGKINALVGLYVSNHILKRLCTLFTSA